MTFADAPHWALTRDVQTVGSNWIRVYAVVKRVVTKCSFDIRFGITLLEVVNMNVHCTNMIHRKLEDVM